jgi:hypothetical protein
MNPERLYEYEIGDSRPNGVVFDKKTKNVFYIHENLLLGYLMNKPGYVGDIKGTINMNMLIPTGIDIDPTIKDNTVLVVGQREEDSIVRITMPNGAMTRHKKLIKSERHLDRYDGLFCMENGDILFAGNSTGQILYFNWDGEDYRRPIVIADGLDNPTDLVIAPSSSGADDSESLYVTTVVFWRTILFPAGKVVEIPGIRTRIKGG